MKHDVCEGILWIPAEEQKPDFCTNVLVTDGQHVGMGWYDFYTRRDTGITEYTWYAPNCAVVEEKISYWAEMPKPPK